MSRHEAVQSSPYFSKYSVMLMLPCSAFLQINIVTMQLYVDWTKCQHHISCWCRNSLLWHSWCFL